MQRRAFIKGACRICLLGAAAGTMATDLMSCNPKISMGPAFSPAIKNNEVEIPLSLFESNPVEIISPQKFEYEIAVEKKGNESFDALLLKCTHYSNQLTTTGNGYTCSLHGSKFDKKGNVLNGPADQPLQHLKTQVRNNFLYIQLT